MRSSRRSLATVRGSAPSSDGEFLWLVSLSDLMILLFVFFVVLFSLAYKKLESRDIQSLTQVFKGQTAVSPLDEIQKKLLKWVVDKKLLESVSVERKEDALILNLKEKVLFAPGVTQIEAEGLSLISTLKEALSKIPAPYRIGIEGHTDDNPIRTSEVQDNLQLSALRAHSVWRSLDLPVDLKSRTLLMGFGEYRPILENRKSTGEAIPENQAANRRVTIRIF